LQKKRESWGGKTTLGGVQGQTDIPPKKLREKKKGRGQTLNFLNSKHPRG